MEFCINCGRILYHTIRDSLCGECRSDTFPFNAMSNEELSNIINISNAQENPFTLKDLVNQYFNPLLLNEIHKLLIFDDIDPDKNYYRTISGHNLKCNYYLEDTLNVQLKSKLYNCNKFCLVHLNVRSAPKKT